LTIKRRLFISNILMIIIPVVVAILSFAVCVVILNAASHGRLFEIFRVGSDAYMQFESFLEKQAAIIIVIVIVAFIAILYVTNRFLTRFVFSKIKQPLDLLSGGTREISSGNLDYRIAYDQEDEFKPVCEDFNSMAARLKASVEEVQRDEHNRKELLAGISHDLRSPLTSIKGFVEGLIDGVAATPEAQREYLGIIRQKTDDINNMVSKLFLYSKLDMGDYPTNPENLTIGEEINDLLNACKEDYKTRGLTIVTTGLQAGYRVVADPVQLGSIIINILDNSAKYKEKETARMEVRCERENGVVRVTFDDDGPGVPEEALPMLFDVFFRSDPSRSNARQGSGLGLAIAAKAAARMNGRIAAENRAEGGLRIVLEIPEAAKPPEAEGGAQ